ncbi:acid sugar phosphatase [Longimycelium tulufanense]|uniref:Acid sugar phosphatase n=1 Tax=Longimycelium tulufanense TaxID=907463 RepID=A0A8J3CDY1_9PSEU|nr:HAD-IIA family hydrolase [Longimycelium tulufanense]GGM79569.1 acid sugar phosphatase [Longimycelium tulufanense]
MTARLLDDYDAVLLDLDGTVFRGGELVPGAAETLGRVRAAGTAIRFVTNNASRSPRQVADHLRDMGLPASPEEVRTSAQAGAAVLAERLPAGANVLVVGTDALRDEVRAQGLNPVRNQADDPVAVVQGHSPDTAWRDLAEACLAIRAGALWVACNVDPTLPSERGELPGSGAMVAALRTATGGTPIVAGKPERGLLAQAAAGAQRALVVGDRLDTDIAGAAAAGMDCLLVLTGVTTPAAALAAAKDHRFQYLAADLEALLRPADEVRIGTATGWRAGLDGDALHLHAEPGGDVVAALRALCGTWWAEKAGPVPVIPADDISRDAVERLGLSGR